MPFSEGASLEEEAVDDTVEPKLCIQELWAKLLVEASRSHDSRHAVFVRILKEITANEVAFLKRLVEGNRARLSWKGSTWNYEDSSIMSTRHLAHFAGDIDFLEDSDISELVIQCFEGPGIMFYDIITGRGKPYGPSEEASYSLAPEYHTDERRAAHAVLISLGIIKEFSGDYMYYDGDRFLDVSGVHLTELGISFLETCSDFKKGRPSTVELIVDREQKEVRHEARPDLQ